MSKQSFSEWNLKHTLANRKFKSRSVSKKLIGVGAQLASEGIINKSYEMQHFHTYSINKKPVYCTRNQTDETVLSRLDENIRNIYRIKQKDRQVIVKQIISLLSEEVPKYIYKLDLESFYENIDINNINSKFINDGVLNTESLGVFDIFSSIIKIQNIKGVPRGIGLSASISELAARPLDEKIRKIEGVYYYARYVDDIIIMSTRRIDINSEINTIIPDGMILNRNKTRVVTAKNCFCSTSCQCRVALCRCWSKCSCQPCGCVGKCKTPSACKVRVKSFDFLGYNFEFPELAKNLKNKIKVDISESKYNKIKNRLYITFKQYKTKGNFKRLEDRLKFLTGNYYVDSRKSKVSSMMAGVYYSYIHINKASKYELLDIFLKKLIFSGGSKKILISDSQKEILNKYSFSKGFKNKYKFEFAPSQVNKIKSGWNNG
ncbi:hypothetical protein EOE67_19390 [Rheinheimera riviphila]|uniref:Reverse transcriptase domain-containing protein n=1 Tax=Rheinheimera riviphila TaxID=1834037 RepID=A0A437QBS9_9GAMM|nr:antiviral reverse transcriptase Drt3a [Rheinheimera riviphila]RVU31976.1 hypothetical protein EOE67_19390 [Rheinheimera riviphila]